MKRLLSFTLVLALVLSLSSGFAVTAFAAGETVTATVQGTYTKSEAEQDVTIRLQPNDLTGPYCMFSMDEITLPTGFKFKSITTSNTAQQIVAIGDYNPNNGKLIYNSSTTMDTIPADTYYDVQITAPANASGEYDIVFNNICVATLFGSNIVFNNIDATATLTINEPTPTSYTISIADGIVGGTVTADPTTAVAGAKITLRNVPANGHTFGSYSVVDANNNPVTVNADGTFTMPASNVTVSATFTQVPTGYNVSLQCADPEIIAAYGETPETAAVTVAVSNTAANAYNAYNLFLSYPEGLTLESYTGSGVQDDNFEVKHDETTRTIQVIGYGADKTLNQSPVTLYFSGATVGNYDVTLTDAYMDIAGNADAKDAPKATIQTGTVTVKVTGYTVTVEGEGLSADSWVAVPGQDFTFHATDYSNYYYKVTAMIGDQKIDVADNNGTYTIDGEDITGNINITATMNPKSYKVFINNVEAVNKATYNTPYTFDAAKEGHTIKSVTAKIGETTLTTTNDGEGNYTIAGTDIKGAIAITIEWEEITPETVSVNSTGAPGFSGAESATKGRPYTFFFTETEKYNYSGLKVEVGEGETKTDITDKLIKNDDGSYTIPANLITGPITITVTQTEINPLAVEVAQYVKLSDSQSIWLVTASGVPDGKIAKYNGLNMYWSAKKQVITVDENGEETQTTGPGYGAYAYLVIAGGSDDEVLAEAMSKVTVADKGQETIVTVDYSGDVNCSNKPDINDAQLVYNMYNAHYSSFDENAGGASMLKFLKADLNGDKGLGTQDALVVVNTILSTNNT